jgi:hypothetical protein
LGLNNFHICIAKAKNHGISRETFSYKKKALPKEHICFSFSTGFLFVKRKSVV